ncbi:exonuclease subunit SbcD, partial [Parabacteroides goldsteinii]|uniref:exonuclease subunit SbcD n=1 Tax=Parabacteroides goldsteinii TaxID=328812 RepID=UPI003EB88BD8
MSLKIIHTADWHLGQTFFGYDREEEHDAFLNWLVDTLAEQQTDVLLIAGDVFDVANPSASAQRRFFHFLKEANRRNPHLQVIVVAGNHDSAARLESPIPLLEELNTSIVGIIRRTA